MKAMLSQRFLESKITTLLEYWNKYQCFGWSGRKQSCASIHVPTQIDLMPNGEFEFILWNMKGTFNGHYKCRVNPLTFEYSVRKHGDYGNLISYLPPSDDTIYTSDNMTDEQRFEIEASIARTILKGCGYNIDVLFGQIQVFVNEVDGKKFKDWNEPPYKYFMYNEAYTASTQEYLTVLWEDFADIPINDNDEIETPFFIWDTGTPRFFIWHWFDERCTNGLAVDLMGEQPKQSKNK